MTQVYKNPRCEGKTNKSYNNYRCLNPAKQGKFCLVHTMGGRKKQDEKRRKTYEQRAQDTNKVYLPPLWVSRDVVKRKADYHFSMYKYYFNICQTQGQRHNIKKPMKEVFS